MRMSEHDSIGIALDLAHATMMVASSLLAPIEDFTIQWGKSMLISDINESDAINEFRMRKADLQEVADKLWPKFSALLPGENLTKDEVRVSHGYTVPYETGFLILLYHLSRPRRLRPDMEKYFGIRRSRLSAIIQTFAEVFYNVALPYLSNPAIFHGRMAYYAELISRKTGGLVNIVWGFIDGTLRKTCRPSYFQRLAYSGHKRSHGIKFQSVVVPDGLIALLFGPVNGCRHDSYLLSVSGVLQQLRELMPEDGSNGIVYSLYGDPAYPQSHYLFGGFWNAAVGSPEAAWNTAMSRVRECVEWGFKEIIAQFSFLDFKGSMKIFQSPVAQYYILGAFFQNIRSLKYSNQTASYFSATTMTLDAYLALVD
jgi:hypothetical protein